MCKDLLYVSFELLSDCWATMSFVTLTFDLQTPKSNQSIFEFKWMLETNLKKFLEGVLEIISLTRMTTWKHNPAVQKHKITLYGFTVIVTIHPSGKGFF